jgi:hypothetical protein
MVPAVWNDDRFSPLSCTGIAFLSGRRALPAAAQLIASGVEVARAMIRASRLASVCRSSAGHVLMFAAPGGGPPPLPRTGSRALRLPVCPCLRPGRLLSVWGGEPGARMGIAEISSARYGAVQFKHCRAEIAAEYFFLCTAHSWTFQSSRQVINAALHSAVLCILSRSTKVHS